MRYSLLLALAGNLFCQAGVNVNLSIFSKLFLVFLCSMALLLTAVLASILWSFRHGFTAYLQAVEAERLTGVTTRLQQAYAEHGDWRFLEHNDQAWLQILRAVTPQNGGFWHEPPAPPPAHHATGHRSGLPSHPVPGGRPPPPPIDPLFPFGHLRLLNADRQTVVGAPFHSTAEAERPLYHGDNIIGWLVVGHNEMITDRLAAAFMTQQTQTSLVLATLALALATGAALLLARQLAQPVRRLAAGVRELSKGHYAPIVDLPSRDEIGQLASDFNRLALTLQKNESERRRWITDISHELRTPIAVLRSELEALQEGIRTPTPDRILSLHSEVMNLSKRVDDLYALSLSDLGAMQYSMQPLDVIALFVQIAQNYQARFAEQNIHFRNLLNAVKPAICMADEARLTQLFSNLLENSCRYTDAGGECTLHASATTTTITLYLDDSAPGVPEAAYETIFKRLYRVQRTREQAPEGAGLGLAICKNIVEAHTGIITASASPLGGLRIAVQLPLAHGISSMQRANH